MDTFLLTRPLTVLHSMQRGNKGQKSASKESLPHCISKFLIQTTALK